MRSHAVQQLRRTSFFVSRSRSATSVVNKLRGSTRRSALFFRRRFCDKKPESLLRKPKQRFWWQKRNLDANPLNVALSGLVGGLLGGMCGVGGGIAMVPMMRHLTRLRMQNIVGLSIFAVAVGAMFAASNYSLNSDLVRMPIAVTMGVTSIVFAWMGASVAASISANALTKSTGLALAVCLPFVVFKMSTDHFDANAHKHNGGLVSQIARGWLNAAPENRETTALKKKKPLSGSQQIKDEKFNGDDSVANLRAVSEKSQKEDWERIQRHLAEEKEWESDKVEWLRRNYHFALVAACAGFLSGLIGVGGGIVWTTYMAAFTDLSQKEAVATSLTAMIPGACISALTHFRYGHIQLSLAAILALSCAVGMLLSSALVTKNIPDNYLRLAFCLLLATTSVRMLLI